MPDLYPRIRRSQPLDPNAAIGFNEELRPHMITFRDVVIGRIVNTHYNQRKIVANSSPSWRLILIEKGGKEILTKLASPDFAVMKQYVRDNYQKVLAIAGHVPG